MEDGWTPKTVQFHFETLTALTTDFYYVDVKVVIGVVCSHKTCNLSYKRALRVQWMNANHSLCTIGRLADSLPRFQRVEQNVRGFTLFMDLKVILTWTKTNHLHRLV